MTKLFSDILYGARLLQVSGRTSVAVDHITFDSREVRAGSLFVAVRGTVSDGHSFISSAEKLGAAAIVCERMPESPKYNVCYAVVDDAAEALGVIASNYYDHPSKSLKLVAVTGTNGKTSVTTLLHRLFSSLGKKCGLLSTVENKILEETIPSTHTTPDAITLQKLLRQMVDSGCEYCFMEASSHAIDQKRIAGLSFAGAAFTNLTRDHLDYHLTFENYLKAKQQLFDKLASEAFALTNLDDRNGKIMVQNSKARKFHYSIKNKADFTGKVMENTFEGLLLNIDGVEINIPLVGEFNASNIMCVYGIARLLGLEQTNVLTAISTLRPAEGRFDYIVSQADRIIGIVDYAHTPDALEKVLNTINEVRTDQQQIITIIGCGGDRDKGKRPMMSKAAGELSDRLILTSDNPRNEDPDSIIDEMRAGVPPHKVSKTLAIVDRREAIRTAVMLAQRNDIILLAGKGHEKYQEIKGMKYPFDDKTILIESLNAANR